MYVAVKGGEAAIDNAHRLLADRRRGDRSVPALTLEQITEQLSIGVDRVMSEGSLYDRRLAALAIKQARGDLIEAIFLVRAYRTTLPRFGHSEPVDTGAMLVERRVSACYKDLPAASFSALHSTTRTACSMRNSKAIRRSKPERCAVVRRSRSCAWPTSSDRKV